MRRIQGKTILIVDDSRSVRTVVRSALTSAGYNVIEAETATEEYNGIQIEILDTGKGIVAERLPYIFDTFSQEDNSISREFGGSGLGLAIVNELVELMGGSIVVESSPGKGTQFTLIIPSGMK